MPRYFINPGLIAGLAIGMLFSACAFPGDRLVADPAEKDEQEQVETGRSTTDSAMDRASDLSGAEETLSDYSLWLEHEFAGLETTTLAGFRLHYPEEWELSVVGEGDNFYHAQAGWSGASVSIYHEVAGYGNCLFGVDPGPLDMAVRYDDYTEVTSAYGVPWRIVEEEMAEGSAGRVYTVCEGDLNQDSFSGVTDVGHIRIEFDSEDSVQWGRIYQILSRIERLPKGDT